MEDTETQKPFACKAKGCRMSFTNEDHLSVHEKKHEMILNLGISKAASVFVADQTPTPTRLIKNCEDVGLFDELKMNPFDETFRLAVESKSQTLPENLLLSEESLHTPQVFPTFEGTTESYREFKVEKQNIILPEKIASKQKKSTKVKKSSIHVAKQPFAILPSPQIKPILLPAINFIPSTQIIAFSIPANAIMQTSRPLLLPKTTTPMEPVQPQKSPEEFYSTNDIKGKLKALLNSPKTTPTTTSSSGKIAPTKRTHTAKFLDKSKSDPKEIYDDCMERRRMAAMRYRWKIKREQCDLKRKNAELTAENNQLKALVKQLKEVLWSHQNCDIANRQQNSSSPASPVKILAQPVLKFYVPNSNPVATLKIPVSSD